MNTISVGFMTLMPALVSFVFVIGIPVMLALLLLSDRRLRPLKALSSAKRPN